MVRAEDRVVQVRVEACKALLAILRRSAVTGATGGDSFDQVQTSILTSLESDPAKYVLALEQSIFR